MLQLLCFNTVKLHECVFYGYVPPASYPQQYLHTDEPPDIMYPVVGTRIEFVLEMHFLDMVLTSLLSEKQKVGKKLMVPTSFATKQFRRKHSQS